MTLDGVLVDTVEIQYESTINAISKYVDINLTKDIEDILRSTITTLKKLDYLVEANIISSEQKINIYIMKKRK